MTADDTVATRGTGGTARDSIEVALSDLWRTTLGVDAVAVDDDLFDVGADSVAGVRILADAERLFDRELDLAEFFSDPTIQALAVQIRSRAGGSGRGPLVRLQGGDGRTPIYAIHPLPGTVLGYTALARALGPAQPVWGLQSLGLEPGTSALHTIEDMAEVYLSHARTVHPGGPWHLLGYSMGGYIALEMARRLRSRGDTVGMLALLDTSAPIDVPTKSPATVRANAIRVLAKYVLRIDADVEQLVELEADQQVRQLLERGIASGALPPDYRSDRIQRMLDVRIANRMAIANYHPAPYAGDILLCRAEDLSLSGEDGSGSVDPRLGWSAFAEHITVIDLPGNHLTIIDPPTASDLAVVLAHHLATQQETT
jgi:thioesterase domain-containing protein